ncbi:putative baseplate assembly protein [Scytonema sp. NUACC21]
MDFEFLPKLPKSNLDDRTFKDLVEECILRIPRYCPEWTNHNPSDPGITLIELFAWLTDQMLMRFNQVPRRNYVAFLELLGIRLNPPEPATCELTFYLTGPQNQEVRIPFATEVATVRTETEEAIIFTTDRELVIGNPQINYFLTADTEEETPRELRDRTPSNGQWQNIEETLLFEQSIPGNCFYLVLSDLENSIAGNVITLTFKGEAARTTGINPNDPPRKWEAWNGRYWQDILRVKDDDKTKGFSFSEIAQPLEGADVILHLPQQLPVADFNTSYIGHWIRCVYTHLQEAQPSYSSSPSIVGLAVRAIGGAVNATQCIRVENELLGVSNGKAGQTFELRSQPILERKADEHIRVRLPGERSENWQDWEPWQEVQDFAESGADEEHYIIDSQTGIVQFGPLIREPSQLKQMTQQRVREQPVGRIVKRENGRANNLNLATYIPPSVENAGNVALERQYGKVPPPGSEVYMVAYRTGGGSNGNVKAEKLTVIRNSIPYVKRVVNYQDASGGIDAESLEQAAIRVPQLLRTRESAVTPEDFERVAMKASASVARAYCLTSKEHTTAGIVRLLIVPGTDKDGIAFRRGMNPEKFTLSHEFKTEILDYMSARKPLGVQVKLEEPEYVGVSVRTQVILEPKYNNPHTREEIRTALLIALYRFLNPLVGGIEGKGWNLGRSVYPSDIVAVCQQIPGVRYLGIVELFGLRQYDGDWMRADIPEPEIDPGPLGLVCSWEDDNTELQAGHIIEFRD